MWLKYNDNEVSVLPSIKQLFDERKLNSIYGGMTDHGAAAYILFYEKIDRNREVNHQVVSLYQSVPMSPTKSTKGAARQR